MTAPTTGAGRRTLTRRATRTEAAFSADAWRRDLGEHADVRVELGGPGATDAFPYVVTANKPTKERAS